MQSNDHENSVWLCSNLKNWNFGIFALFFNADKDLRGSSKLEFFDHTIHMAIFSGHFGTNSNIPILLEQIPIFWNLGISRGCERLGWRPASLTHTRAETYNWYQWAKEKGPKPLVHFSLA